MTYWT